MKKVWFLSVIITSLHLAAQDPKTFSSYETLEGLKTIEIYDNLCVVLYPTYFHGVQIKGDRSSREAIKWNYENNTLKLFTVQENILAANAEIIIFVSDFKELKLFQKASVQTDKKIVTDHFTVYAADNAIFDLPLECLDFHLITEDISTGYLTVEAKNTSIIAKGASSTTMKLTADMITLNQKDKSILSIKGKAQTLSATIENKATLSAWALLAKDVYLFSSNTEDIHVFADNRLKINGQGSGKIYVTGNPIKVDTIGLNKKTRIFYRSQYNEN